MPEKVFKFKPSVLYFKVRRQIFSTSPTVTFVFSNKSKMIQPLNDKFIKDDNGRIRKISEIIKDLKAIQNDLGAEKIIA